MVAFKNLSVIANPLTIGVHMEVHMEVHVVRPIEVKSARTACYLEMDIKSLNLRRQ